MKRKRLAVLVLALLLLCGCGEPENFDAGVSITVVSREDGSGTRTAFTELLGLQRAAADGEVFDETTMEAVTINSTAVMLNTVSSNAYAIGYISFGSLNDSVKALKIDGVSPVAENILNGSYPIARPFLAVTKGAQSKAAQDFIGFILSAEGQMIVSTSGYIPLEGALPYGGSKPTGKVVVAGSSSVSPVMEKLKEAYTTLNPGAIVEVQQSDSSTGINAVLEGICDIGMASRQLKESELGQGLVPAVIAMDGIAVVVNNSNPMKEMTGEQVRAIYSGQAARWNDVVE